MQSLEVEIRSVCPRKGKDGRMLEPSDLGLKGEIKWKRWRCRPDLRGPCWTGHAKGLDFALEVPWEVSGEF